jgi:hypothetical protein
MAIPCQYNIINILVWEPLLLIVSYIGNGTGVVTDCVAQHCYSSVAALVKAVDAAGDAVVARPPMPYRPPPDLLHRCRRSPASAGGPRRGGGYQQQQQRP